MLKKNNYKYQIKTICMIKDNESIYIIISRFRFLYYAL